MANNATATASTPEENRFSGHGTSGKASGKAIEHERYLLDQAHGSPLYAAVGAFVAEFTRTDFVRGRDAVLFSL